MWILGLKGLKEVNNIQLKLALRTPAQYRHLIITDSFLCPWVKPLHFL